MNLIMNGKRCSLDSINLDALRRISFRKKKLESNETEEVIDVWKNTKNSNLFHRLMTLY